MGDNLLYTKSLMVHVFKSVKINLYGPLKCHWGSGEGGSSSHLHNKSWHSICPLGLDTYTVKDLAVLVNTRTASGDKVLHLDNYPAGILCWNERMGVRR